MRQTGIFPPGCLLCLLTEHWPRPKVPCVVTLYSPAHLGFLCQSDQRTPRSWTVASLEVLQSMASASWSGSSQAIDLLVCPGPSLCECQTRKGWSCE